jgi:hypothetical protein
MRRLAAVVLVVFGLLALPTRAEAQGFWRWLEELSGPGPFHDINGFEIPLTCFEAPSGRQGVELLPPWRCLADSGINPKVTLSFDIASGTGKNNLSYAPTAFTGEPGDVSARLYGFAVTYNLVPRAVDVGMLVGRLRLGSLPVVDSVTRTRLEPRLVVRPLVFGVNRDDERGRYRASWLELRLVPLILPKRFTGGDLGSTTDLGTGAEILMSYMVVINVVPLLGR